MRQILTNEEIIEKLKKYTTLQSLRIEDLNLYQLAKRRGLDNYIPSKEKRSQTTPKYKKWTNEEVIEVISKYDDLRELRKYDNSFYAIAKRKGLDEYLPKRIRTEKINWGTDEDIINIINSYTTYKDFMKEMKRLSVYISQNRPHLREWINKLERVKERRPNTKFKKEEHGWTWVGGGKGNIIPKYRNIKLEIDGKIICVGNDIRGELRMELLRNGFIYIFKPIK